MSILQIELPDEQLQRISEQARAQGYQDNGEFLLAVVQKLVGQSLHSVDDHPTPEQLERQKKLLLESLEDDPQVADEAWWAKLQSDVDAQVASKASARQNS